MARRFARWLHTAMVIGLCAWPGIQYCYHRTTDNDPWRLAGFAMYATPQPQLAVSFLPQGGARSLPIDGRCSRPLPHYLRARLAFGTRSSARELIECLRVTARSGPGQLELMERRFDAGAARFRIERARFAVGSEPPTPGSEPPTATAR